MLATLIDKPFDDKGWVFEIKWDGYRALAYKNRHVILLSRNQKSFNERFGHIVDDLKRLPGSFIVDGEIVILDKKGRSQFQALQNYQREKELFPVYYVFDLLFINGRDVRSLPLLERKTILKKLLRQGRTSHIQYSDHIAQKGIALFKKIKKLRGEGIIAKKMDSPYQSQRSRDWLKIKTGMRQEVVIGGFTEPRGSRKFFGALLVGVYAKGELHFAGHVGGGFDHKLLKRVYDQLKPLITDRSAFVEKIVPNTPVNWVKPKLVCEVSFSEWTREGAMRHPIFKGMREDKKAKEVVREG